MSKHEPCGAPVGVSRKDKTPKNELPTCVLAVQHIGPHMDEHANVEYMTVGKRKSR